GAMRDDDAKLAWQGPKTMEEVRANSPSMAFYSARTCWWTTDPGHLYIHPNGGIPCDRRSGVLFETKDVEGFLRAAEENAEHYGPHGLRAFLAAHHGNVVTVDGRPTCFVTWAEYNALLDKEEPTP